MDHCAQVGIETASQCATPTYTEVLKTRTADQLRAGIRFLTAVNLLLARPRRPAPHRPACTPTNLLCEQLKCAQTNNSMDSPGLTGLMVPTGHVSAFTGMTHARHSHCLPSGATPAQTSSSAVMMQLLICRQSNNVGACNQPHQTCTYASRPPHTAHWVTQGCLVARPIR